MNITPPKPITTRVAKMGDYADECQRIRENDLAEKQELEQQARLDAVALSEHYIQSWEFHEYMEAMDYSDKENQKRFEDLVRSQKDDMELGRQVRHMIEAYAFQIADRKV